ncbi:MAG: NUDIX hydrolase [Cytophagaceae bacterium]
MKRKAKIVFYTNRNNKVRILLGKRNFSENEYFWWIPGGSIEQGENEFEALQRELSEELVLTSDQQEILSTFKDSLPKSYTYTSANSSVTVFFIKLSEENLPQIVDEFNEIQWFEKNNLPDNMSREFQHIQEIIKSLE